MDSFTHALTAAILVYASGRPELIPFAVAGAVILDADVFVARLFDGRPERYLVTHGGITHSLAGAAMMALPAYAVAAVVGPAAGFPTPAAPIALAAALGGAYLHLGLDWLACPGIPLLAPRSDRKYTVGLLPGPSVLLMATSIVVLVLMALGLIAWPAAILPYLAIIAAFLTVRLAAFVCIRVNLPGAGRFIPRTSPLRWLVIGEAPDAWTVGDYRVGTGMTGPAVYPKYRETTADAVAPYLGLPEVRRVRYHSYITTAAREGDTLEIADPLRTSRQIFYPPYFAEARIPLQESAGTGATS